MLNANLGFNSELQNSQSVSVLHDSSNKPIDSPENINQDQHYFNGPIPKTPEKKTRKPFSRLDDDKQNTSKNGSRKGNTKKIKNRNIRSKSCSAVIQDTTFYKKFGSPRPDNNYDIFSGGRMALCPIVVPSGPPDFDTIVPRKALCHQFCRQTRSWTHTECRVRIGRSPFAKGTARHAYYLKIDKPRSKLDALQPQIQQQRVQKKKARSVNQGCGGRRSFQKNKDSDSRPSIVRGDDGDDEREDGPIQVRLRRQQRHRILHELPDHRYLSVST